jgi:hypothetical protein
MAKKAKSKSTWKTTRQSEPECLELLKEFVRIFETIPQQYCLFCEANTALGWRLIRKTVLGDERRN